MPKKMVEISIIKKQKRNPKNRKVEKFPAVLGICADIFNKK
jgi:hypothetical protein